VPPDVGSKKPDVGRQNPDVSEGKSRLREALIKSYAVVPAEAGTQDSQRVLDPRLRGDDT